MQCAYLLFILRLAMPAGMNEEVGEVYLIFTVFLFGKSDPSNESFINLFGESSFVDGIMHAAKVDKVESGSAEHEKCLPVVFIRGRSNVMDKTAVLAQLELRDTAEFIFNGCFI